MQPDVPQSTQIRIESWLKSLEQDIGSEPLTKRARCQEPCDDDLTYSTLYNTARPQTPPLTDKTSMASGPAQTPRRGARKRGPDDIEDIWADVDDGEEMQPPLLLNCFN